MDNGPLSLTQQNYTVSMMYWQMTVVVGEIMVTIFFILNRLNVVKDL